MGAALTYSPLGIDAITFACYDVRFWEPALRRLGFETIPSDREAAAQQGSVAMAHGDVRAVLVDPTTGGAETSRFLVEHGDMQVLSTGILVEDVAQARQDLSTVVECSPVETVEDPLGGARRFRIVLPYPSTVTWQVVERLGGRPVAATDAQWKARAVDHFAIAVADLSQWEALYHSLGFETIYVPKSEIAGEHSAMKTVAVQRGGWVVALVEGVDREQPSQVSTYVRAHADHAIQHAAVRFDDLRATLRELLARGVQCRLQRLRQDPNAPAAIEDILHEGRDHSGPLLQCFTKPLARRPDLSNPEVYEGGFFFELIQRIAPVHKAGREGQAFHDPTVIGLYRSIEYEELARDSGLIFSDMGDYRFPEWLANADRV